MIEMLMFCFLFVCFVLFLSKNSAVATCAGTVLLIILASLSSATARLTLAGERMSDGEGACVLWEEALALLSSSWVTLNSYKSSLSFWGVPPKLSSFVPPIDP